MIGFWSGWLAGTSKRMPCAFSIALSVRRVDDIGVCMVVDWEREDHAGPAWPLLGNDDAFVGGRGDLRRLEVALAFVDLLHGLILTAPWRINSSRRSLKALHFLVGWPTN